MSDLLAVTLGNTTAALAVATEGRLGDVLRVPVARLDELRDGFARVRRAAAPAGRAAGEGVPVVVASVNPEALNRFRRLAANVAQKLPEVAGVDFPIPIRADVDEPDKVGVDRLLAALAAFRRAKRASIVIDCGTAVTVNLVDAGGTFIGGAIFPGPRLLAKALHEGTAQLPLVDPAYLGSIAGRNTRDAIRAGISLGSRGALLGLLAAAMAEVGDDAAVFLTGGGAAEAKSETWGLTAFDEESGEAKKTPGVFSSEGAFRVLGRKDTGNLFRPQVVPDLVLEGLVLAYREWQTR